MRSVIASAAAALIFAGPAHADSIHLVITLALRDFAQDARVDAESIDLPKTPEVEHAELVGESYSLDLELEGAEEIKDVDLEIRPKESYASRELSLRIKPQERKKMTRHVRVFVVAKEQAPTYAGLQAARAHLREGHIERALALFEFANSKLRESDSKIQYGINARYNYARALLDACTQRGYATCDDAARICRELEDDLVEVRHVFDAERVSAELLAECKRNAEAVSREEADLERRLRNEQLASRIRDAQTAIRAGGPASEQGAAELEAVISEPEALAIASGLLRVTPASLHRDAGIGYVRFAEHLSKAPGDAGDPSRRAEILSLGVERLGSAVKLGDASRRTEADLAYARRRLDAVAAPAPADAPAAVSLGGSR